jgi:hypothetical protein
MFVQMETMRPGRQSGQRWREQQAIGSVLRLYSTDLRPHALFIDGVHRNGDLLRTRRDR